MAIQWTAKQTAAAFALADGLTQKQASEVANVHENTVQRWMRNPEYSAEVDRLTLMTGIASRAERMRIVRRVVRDRVQEEVFIRTEKDLLDWLKFAQSETDGAKLDLTSLAELVGLLPAAPDDDDGD